MLRQAYGDKSELFLLGDLGAQKPYNSARNLESIAWNIAWRLVRNRDKRGQLRLLSHGTKSVLKLSFERLFGKMTVTQDMFSHIIAGQGECTINKIVHRIVSAIFLPVG